MIALLWGRIQGIIATIVLVLGAIVSAWIVGRKSGIDKTRAQAAALEQQARSSADAAARVAQQSTAADRMRDGKF